MRTMHIEMLVRLYTVIVISIQFSPKPGCVEKFVKYLEIPLSCSCYTRSETDLAKLLRVFLHPFRYK